MLKVKTDKDKIDPRLIDKDALYSKFEQALMAANYADIFIKALLATVKPALDTSDDELEHDKWWNNLMETLSFPYYIKCIKSEPNILINEINGEFWVSGDVILMDPESELPNMEKRLRFSYEAIDDTPVDLLMMKFIITNSISLERALVFFEEDARDYINSNHYDLSSEEINYWKGVLINIQEVRKTKLLPPVMCVVNNKEEKENDQQ